MNYSNTTNATSYIQSPTHTKEFQSVMYPIMSTGMNGGSSSINNNNFGQHFPMQDDSGTINSSSNQSNCTIVPMMHSPPPVPKFTVPHDRMGPSSSSLSRLDDHRALSVHLDSTSGREDLTEDGEVVTVLEDPADTGSQSTRLFSINGGGGASESSTADADNDSISRDCASGIDSGLTVCLGVVAVATPVLMTALPRLTAFTGSVASSSPSDSSTLSSQQRRQLQQCGTACEGALVFLGTKLALLAVASLILFCRRRTHSFPRVLVFKLVLLVMLFTVIFAFWIFYVLRILLSVPSVDPIEYEYVVQFASSVTDVLIFTHYLSVVMLEIRHLETRFCVKVIRSPDGECKFYQLGNISIQAAAVRILQNYVVDFPMLNGSGSRRGSSYSRAAGATLEPDVQEHHRQQSRTVPSPDRTRHSRHHRRGSLDRVTPPSTPLHIGSESLRLLTGVRERIFREMELDKRLRKRRLRLLASAEHAFSGLKRVPGDDSSTHTSASGPTRMPATATLTSAEAAADTLLVQLARPLQKYLRPAHLQAHFPRSRVRTHLSRCLQAGLSAQAFLCSLLWSPRVLDTVETLHGQLWTVLCDRSLSRGLCHDLSFLLRRDGVSLLCVVQHVPLFTLSEEILSSSGNAAGQRFVIKFNSETSV